MRQKEFEGLTIGMVVRNVKTSKKWMVTDFVASYSSAKKNAPDVYQVRLSNSSGKHSMVTVEHLRKYYRW